MFTFGILQLSNFSRGCLKNRLPLKCLMGEWERREVCLSSLPNVCCAQVCVWEEVRRVESREYRELQSLYEESERRLKQVSETRTRLQILTQTGSHTDSFVSKGRPVATLMMNMMRFSHSDWFNSCFRTGCHSAATDKKLSLTHDFFAWHDVNFPLFWSSLFTTVTRIPIQGGAMGVCDSDPCRDVLPLPSEGSHITRILGKCTFNVPWLPSWFDTAVLWGDEPLHVLPSGRRSKVSFKWHSRWISSSQIF